MKEKFNSIASPPVDVLAMLDLMPPDDGEVSENE